MKQTGLNNDAIEYNKFKFVGNKIINKPEDELYVYPHLFQFSLDIGAECVCQFVKYSKDH